MIELNVIMYAITSHRNCCIRGSGRGPKSPPSSSCGSSYSNNFSCYYNYLEQHDRSLLNGARPRNCMSRVGDTFFWRC